jgi:hypothetical protein
VFLLFLAILFPINFWALLFFLQELPAYLLRLSLWDIIGILSYGLTLALIDSLIILGITLLIGFFIPRRIVRGHEISSATSVAYSIIVWVIPIHFRNFFIEKLPVLQSGWVIWLWTGLVILLCTIFIYIFLNNEVLEDRLTAFLERLSVLSTVYLIMNGLGLLITAARNAGLG